jgi:PAS domain S-box-containing protein
VEGKMQSRGEPPSPGGYIRFEPGLLTPEEIKAIFNTLPVDITFVDKDGAVKYFTQGKDRIFARPASIIGRQVANCHPPASVHVVERIVEDLKSGKKDHEDFWIRMGERFVHIRYFAVRNEKGEFLGIMEFTQDIKPIQDITGEKRLISE